MLYIFHVDIKNSLTMTSQTSEYARSIFHAYIMYLEASTDVKMAIFLVENREVRLLITKWTFEQHDLIGDMIQDLDKMCICRKSMING